MTALNTMPQVTLEMDSDAREDRHESSCRRFACTIPSEHIAFFERATISAKRDGDEILPIEYDDNYVTVFPGETAEIHGIVRKGPEAPLGQTRRIQHAGHRCSNQVNKNL